MKPNTDNKTEEKLYFKNEDAEHCHPLSYFIHDAKIEELSEITIFEAVPDTLTSDYVYCTYFGEMTEKSECKKSQCSKYESKSGRGKCSHKGNLYYHGEAVIIKID